MSLQDRALHLLEAVAPLPLTYGDLTDELGITRKHAHKLISRLQQCDRVRKDCLTHPKGPGANTLIYSTPPEAPA